MGQLQFEEYFANGFEKYFLDDPLVVQKISPILYEKIESILMSKREHISYSELKDWVLCPHYHKKSWIERVAPFEGNEYTAFGTAIHDVCEKKLLKEDIDEAEVFQIGFDKIAPRTNGKKYRGKWDKCRSNANVPAQRS